MKKLKALAAASGMAAMFAMATPGPAHAVEATGFRVEYGASYVWGKITWGGGRTADVEYRLYSATDDKFAAFEPYDGNGNPWPAKFAGPARERRPELHGHVYPSANVGGGVQKIIIHLKDWITGHSFVSYRCFRTSTTCERR